MPVDPNGSFDVSAYGAIREKDASSLSQGVQVDDQNKIWDALTRNGLAVGIMGAFLLVNVFSLSVLVWLGREDQHDLVRKPVQPGERLVDKDVIMSPLGASTVQLGSIAVIMAKYVFKPPG